MGIRSDNKLLIISGPTATGKTAFAEILAKKYHGNLISADSRQIYRGLNIGTGKDHLPHTPISLIDIVDINQPFSAHEFYVLAQEKILLLQSQKILPIIVGGTGHYLRTLLNPHNLQYSDFRKNVFFPILNRLPTNLLQAIYRARSQTEYSRLNNSEKHNPQRLIKRILSPNQTRSQPPQKHNILHLHLTAPNTYLHKKIDDRIQIRLQIGLISEITKILTKYHWQDPGLKTIAYQEFQDYFLGKCTLSQAIASWTTHEKQYVKRQKTYFAKMNPKISFDVSCDNWLDEAINTVDKWYNQ